MLASPLAVKTPANPQTSTAAVEPPSQAALEEPQHLKSKASAPRHRAAAAPNGIGDESPRRRPEDIPAFSAGERGCDAWSPIHPPHIAMQARLRVGQTDDPLEHEADRVAAEVMRAPASHFSIAPALPQIGRRTILSSSSVAESRPPSAHDLAGAAPGIAHRVLRAPGQPMDAKTRAFMEPRFGRDFGHIRIHSDATAAQSAKALNARAYTAGNSIVFAAGEFAPHSTGGRSLLAHELTHAIQQGGQPQLIQRAPANYGSSAQPDSAAKAKPQITADDVMGFLVNFRRSSQQEFVNFLAKNEAQLYPLLNRFGFKGSWVKSEDYLRDFDAAAARWGKADRYRQQAARAAPPKPKSREERKFEDAQVVLWELENHPRETSQVNETLESAGLMDDLVGLPIVADGKERTFEKEGRWSHVAGPFYSRWAAAALRVYIQRYRDAHNIPAPRPDKITSGEEIDISNARGDALESMEGSILGAISGGVAMHFSDDPRVVAAAAGLGAAVEGALGAVGYGVAGKGSYQPDVENKPAEAYTNNRDRISEPHDPAKVGEAPVREKLPQPDSKPASAPDPYEKLSAKELKKLAKTDREAAEALRLRYRKMTDAELGRLAKKGDAMAESVRGQRTPPNTSVENLPRKGEDRFSEGNVYDRLQQAIRASRQASGIRRSGPHAVTPEAEVQGGVVGAAMTDVPGLEDRTYLANSPVAGGHVNHDSKFKPASDYDVLPHTHGHAEQGLADQIDADLSGIPVESLKGRTVWMLIEQVPCSTCAAGTTTSDPEVEAGVLSKLSKAYPMVKFEVKHLDGSNKLTLNQGKESVAPLRKPVPPRAPGGSSQP